MTRSGRDPAPDEPGDPRRQRSRLARAGAGEDAQLIAVKRRRRSLLVVQLVEVQAVEVQAVEVQAVELCEHMFVS